MLRSPSVDEVAVAQMWRAIGDERAARSHQATQARSKRAVAIAVAFAAVVALSWSLAAFRRTQLIADDGLLRLSSGAEIAMLDAPTTEPATVTLSDGSVISLGSGARLRPLENSRSVFAALLASGHVGFKVNKG